MTAVARYHLVAERDHELQNPTTPEKIRLVGELLRLGPDTRVLDVACGRGGPAIVLAAAFGCRVAGIEVAAEFAEVARARAAETGLADRIELIEADASEHELGSNWDVALCLGATFIWGGLGGTLAALVPALKPGGGIAIGEPYWRAAPPPDADDMGYLDLEETVATFEAAGLAPVGLVAASEDDWDRYESLHWRAVEEWLAGSPGGPDAEELRAEHDHHRRNYVRVIRPHLGWAILVGRKPG